MAADVIVKMRANTKEWDGGLAKAKKGLDQFVQSNTTLNGILAQGMTQLTRYAGGFAAAELAMKTFNSVVMEGSQTTGDFVRNSLGALSDTLGIVASDMATLDFSNLSDGLASVYGQALKVRDVLDSLGDTLRGLGIAGDAARAAIAELREVNSDAGASAAQHAAAQAKAVAAIKDYAEVASTANKETEAWISTQVKNAGGFKTIKTTTEDVKNLTVAYAKLDSAGKSSYKAEAAAAHKELAGLKKALDVAENGEKRWVSSYTGYGGGGSFKVTPKGTDRQISAARRAVTDFEAANTALLQSYVLFERNSDKAMDDMAQKIQSMSQTTREVTTLQRQYNAAAAATPSYVKTAVSSKSGASQSVVETRPVQSVMDVGSYQKSMNELSMGIPSMKTLTDYAARLKAELSEATSSARFNALEEEYARVREAIELQPLAIRAGISINEASWMEQIQAQFDALRESMHLEMGVDVKLNEAALSASSEAVSAGGKKARASWEAAAQALSSAGSALQNIDNKGLSVAGIIMEAIGNVALGFSAALKEPATTAAGVFGWIAAAAAGLATMTATIAAIKAQTRGSYAGGGIVPGAYNGGVDSTYVYASPGELILNRAQQESLLGQLDGGVGDYSVRLEVPGEKLVAVINNLGRRRGWGTVRFG